MVVLGIDAHKRTHTVVAVDAAGEQIVRVPPKLMAGTRRSARTDGKSDPIDALAVARAALREPGLPCSVLGSGAAGR
jgi:transposase